MHMSIILNYLDTIVGGFKNIWVSISYEWVKGGGSSVQI